MQHERLARPGHALPVLHLPRILQGSAPCQALNTFRLRMFAGQALPSCSYPYMYAASDDGLSMTNPAQDAGGSDALVAHAPEEIDACTKKGDPETMRSSIDEFLEHPQW